MFFWYTLYVVVEVDSEVWFMKNTKNNSNSFGYAEVIGTCIMILSSAFFVAAILMSLFV